MERIAMSKKELVRYQVLGGVSHFTAQDPAAQKSELLLRKAIRAASALADRASCPGGRTEATGKQINYLVLGSP